MSVTYTIISEGNEDKKITIDDNTTVREAIEMINLCVGENDQDENDQDENQLPLEQELLKYPGIRNERLVKFENLLDDSSNNESSQESNELVEIFGLSAYTDRSVKFNTLKFPNNELIVYLVPLDNLFIKSSPGVHADPIKLTE